MRQLTNVLTGGNCHAVMMINKSNTLGSTVGNVVDSGTRGGRRVTVNVVPGKVKGSFTEC